MSGNLPLDYEEAEDDDDVTHPNPNAIIRVHNSRSHNVDEENMQNVLSPVSQSTTDLTSFGHNKLTLESGLKTPHNEVNWRQPSSEKRRTLEAPRSADKRNSNVTLLSTHAGPSTPRWNLFRSVPSDKENNEPQWMILLSQIFKCVAYVVMHLIVMCSGFMAKMIMLLMVANLNKDLQYTPCKSYGDDGAFVAQDPLILPAGAANWFLWGLFFALNIPEVLTFLRCMRMICFKFEQAPALNTLLVALLFETLRTIGVSLLVFVVLPGVDSVRGVMLTCAVASIPAALSTLSHIGPRSTRVLAFFDAVAFFMQFTGVWLWPALDPSVQNPGLMSVALLLISVGWWENYVSKSAKLRVVSYLGEVKDRLHRSRYKTYVVVSVWKILVSLFVCILAGGSNHGIDTIFSLDSPHRNITTIEDADDQVLARISATTMYLWIWMIVSAFVCYETAKYACKVKMERFSYAVPVISVIPACIMVLVSSCEAKKTTACYFTGWLLPDTTFWNCEYGTLYDGLIVEHLGWAWILWFGSYIWIVSHVFLQKPGRLSKTDTLFLSPMYDGLFVDQSLTLNRRRMHVSRIKTDKLRDEEIGDNVSVLTEATDMSLMYSMTSLSLANSNLDSITKIYICATMWHENVIEMLQMIKSIIRMDEDQSARKNAQKYLKVVDPDYYELEAHIFFDDAWEEDEALGCRVPNSYVQQFISVMDESASAVHKVWLHLKPPVKIDTQYGGRLVWTLPGDNRLFLHMKDKTKIRHKKRWSQVMYMYYLLGFRIMELIPDVARKQVLAENTFLLTIDGDSNFHPSSVQKLVDLMKKHSRIGSACGRIHPIGSGMMVWYQKFEYAIAHWLQKATEHVFGCVLCSPGCFSLFRGSALMDDNVMNKYTKLALEARHFVQFDQGEDRWLSTLLLKQGYRIEYAAAADADTYAPEGFSELFNQRRRWTPSSIANTVDLLTDYKKACRNNDSLSKIFVAYQMVVIAFSLMGPAIIFTMMVFAQVAAFHIPSSTIMWANLVPVLFYVVACFVASSDTQLTLAKFMSVGYAFIMMAVLVGTGIQIAAEGMGSPTTIFIMAMGGLFCGAAMLHPLEMPNIFYGLAFFLMIPCTYVLMSLYSLINLNVINWGTREAAAKATGGGDESLTPMERFLKKVRGLKDDDASGNTAPGTNSCNCLNLCSCSLCPGGNSPTSRLEDERMKYLDGKLQRLDYNMDKLADRVDTRYNMNLHKGVARTNTAPALTSPTAANEAPFITLTHASPVKRAVIQPTNRKISTASPPNHANSLPSHRQFSEDTHPLVTAMEFQNDDRYKFSTAEPSNVRRRSSSISSISSMGSLSRAEDLRPRSASVSVSMNSPTWMKHDALSHCPHDILDELESQFWTELITTYLKPLKKDKDKELQDAHELLELRNMIAFALLLLNGLLVLIIYLLQINANMLSIEFEPYENYTWNKLNPLTGKHEAVQEPLKIEPIGFTIILFLSFILIVQTAGMLLHRMNTLTHILASTVLPCFKRRKSEDLDGDQLLEDNAVEIARRLQQLSDPAKDDKYPVGGNKAKRRKRIVFDLEREAKGKSKSGGLDAVFKRRFMNFEPKNNKSSFKGMHLDKGAMFFDSDVAQQKTAEAIKQRRDSVAAEEAQTFDNIQNTTKLSNQKLYQDNTNNGFPMSANREKTLEKSLMNEAPPMASFKKPVSKQGSTGILAEIEKMMAMKGSHSSIKSEASTQF